MADQRTARPVSGEIMTSARAFSHRGLARNGFADVVDADFEVIGEEGSGTGSRQEPPSPNGMNMLLGTAVSTPMATASRRGGPVFWLIGIGLVAASFWVSGGHAFIRGLPILAAPQPAPMLVISGVTSRVDVSGPRPLLFVDGEAVNGGNVAGQLPELEIRVTGNDGRTTRYNLGTFGRSMSPGERFAFSSRLDVPKNGVRTVSVAFAE